MKRYTVEVNASNRVTREFDTMQEVVTYLKSCNGTASVLDNTKQIGWQEIYFGNANKFSRSIEAKSEQ